MFVAPVLLNMKSIKIIPRQETEDTKQLRRSTRTTLVVQMKKKKRTKTSHRIATSGHEF